MDIEEREGSSPRKPKSSHSHYFFCIFSEREHDPREGREQPARGADSIVIE
jgi:hypothetical protein